MPSILASLALLAALGVGIASLSNSAAPGDLLYPFKIDVNERIEGYIARSDEAKAQWDVDAIQNRLNEAGRVAASGSLTDSTRTMLQTNIDQHAKDLTARIERLQAQGAGAGADAANIAAQFQGSLAAQTATLGSHVSSDSTPDTSGLTSFLDYVRGEINAASVLSSR